MATNLTISLERVNYKIDWIEKNSKDFLKLLINAATQIQKMKKMQELVAN